VCFSVFFFFFFFTVRLWTYIVQDYDSYYDYTTKNSDVCMYE